MNTEELYQLFLKYPKVSTDSRSIEKDSLFFALRGDNFDGNKYAEDALLKGAAYAIIDNPVFKKEDRFVLVPDVLKALQLLANHHRNTLSIPVLGITGTNGKTTTKELIAAVLSVKYKVHSTKGNLNNHIGVPLTLLQLNKQHEFAVIEMGASKPGDIAELCEIANPVMAIITNIGRAHLEGFGSPEGVVKTKSELYHYVSKQKNNIVFFNSNDTVIAGLVGQIKFDTIRSYGFKDTDFCSGHLLASDPFVSISIQDKSQMVKIQSQLVGAYNSNNIMAAACIGKYMGIGMHEIATAIDGYKPVNNRSQLTDTKGNTLMLDCYNANPTSMKAAIESFSAMPTIRKKRVLILGDMLELGVYADLEHQTIVSLLEQRKDIDVFLVGFLFEKNSLHSKLLRFKSYVELMEHIQSNPIEDAFILIKGSRGIKLEKVIDVL